MQKRPLNKPSRPSYKSPGETRTQWTKLSIMKTCTAWYCHGQHQINWREIQMNITKIRNKTRLSSLVVSIQYSTWRFSYSNKTTERDQIRKEEIKIFLFAGDMIVYESDSKNSTRELLQMTNTFSQVAGYKINLKKKSVALLYTNDK